MATATRIHPAAEARPAEAPAAATARDARLPRLGSTILAYRWPLLVAGWALVVLALALVNLEAYPTTWFDEGSHLHVPKTLVREGVYADRSSEGYRYFGPTTGVGPTVLLPIAGAFAVAGVGLVPARLVIVAYLLVALVLFALLTRRLHGNLTAVVASVLLVVTPGINLLYLGRQVLGEVPALAFLLAGLLAWCRAVSPGDPSTPLLRRSAQDDMGNAGSQARAVRDDLLVAGRLPRSRAREMMSAKPILAPRSGAGGEGHPAGGEDHPAGGAGHSRPSGGEVHPAGGAGHPRTAAGGRLPLLLAAAACFGLAALTKSQLALILLGTFAVLLVADRLYYRVLGWRHTLLPLAAVVGGAGLGQAFPLLPLIGTDELARTLALAREASSGAIFVFSPGRVLSSLKFLLSADVFAFWALPGLLYGLALARPRNARGVQHALLAIFACVGLGWFAFGSIGWPRYAFPGLAILAIFVARLLVDLLMLVRRATAADPLGRAARTLTPAIAIFLVVMAGSSLFTVARTITTTSDRSPQEVAAFLSATIPTATVIETWEPELGVLTDHAYHYPPSGWLDRAVRARWLGGTPAPIEYDPTRESPAAYLVVGKFGTYAGIYAPYLERAQPERITSIGEYDVYRLGGRP